MKIKEILKKINMYKELLMNYQDSINYYNECLNNDEKMVDLLKRPFDKVFVQESRNNIAPQEKVIITNEKSRKKVLEEIEYYKNKRNEIFIKLFLVEKGFEFLERSNSEEGIFLIECRYFEGMNWNDIDRSFNNKFRHEKMVGYYRMSDILQNTLKEFQEYIDSYPLNKIDFSYQFKNKYLT